MTEADAQNGFMAMITFQQRKQLRIGARHVGAGGNQKMREAFRLFKAYIFHVCHRKGNGKFTH